MAELENIKILSHKDISLIISLFKDKVQYMTESLTIQNHLLDAISETIKSRK